MLCWPLLLPLGLVSAAFAQPWPHDLSGEPHRYWERQPRDPFTRIKADLESGRVALDRSNEPAFVLSLLRALDIRPSSQLLVFSTTSLQISRITPATPRALYFNDDVYLGWVRRGRIEVIALDPDLGGIFYIFDIPREGEPLRIERSDRCMNCHAGAETGYVPGLLVKSVIPGPNRGSLVTFREDSMGHGVPFAERFGGWYVTGQVGATNHWANLTGRLFQGELTTYPVTPGVTFDFSDYPAPTSDAVAHLVHEHQAGFVNLAIDVAYRARSALHRGAGVVSSEDAGPLDEQADRLTRYLLFADEVPLSGGISGDPVFQREFLANKRPAGAGASLKDFDLQTRLFKHRCSYMIYSPLIAGLPAEMKGRLFARLDKALDPAAADEEYGYLPLEEKTQIRRILRETLTDLPAGW
jgi:hypothetical protein